MAMNLPNRLTLLRIALIPLFLALLLGGAALDGARAAAAYWGALVVFGAAAVTDYLDGAIARRHNLTTNFGQLFDPLADKLLTMAAFVSFVELRIPGTHSPIFPAWAIILILAREFLVTGIRALAGAQGRVIAADRWGKHKTIWQLIGILLTLLVLSAVHSGVPPGAWMLWLLRSALAIIVGLTTFSGVLYFVRNRELLRDDA